MNITSTIVVEISDEQRLRAYTSGFMPETASLGQRVTAILAQGGHPIHPDVNGIAVVSSSEEQR